MQEGDWMDTLQMPVLSPLGNTAVGLRIQPGPYAGYAVSWPASGIFSITHIHSTEVSQSTLPPLLAEQVV